MEIKRVFEITLRVQDCDVPEPSAKIDNSYIKQYLSDMGKEYYVRVDKIKIKRLK